MKQHRLGHDESMAQSSLQLASAFLSMRTEEECLSLLEDLCTPAELEAMIDRWRVALLLEQGIPYREIHDQTGVSVTTIGRVARFLSRGAGGYRLALQRMSDDSGPSRDNNGAAGDVEKVPDT